MKNFAIAFALVAASASTAVFADGATYEYPDQLKSTVTRAEVRADALSALKNGELPIGEVNMLAGPSRSMVSRSQVQAEAREAQRLGLIGGGEVTPLATPAQQRAVQAAGDRAQSPQVSAMSR